MSRFPFGDTMFQKLKDFLRVRQLRKLCKPGELVRQGYWRSGGVKHRGKQIWVRASITRPKDRNQTRRSEDSQNTKIPISDSGIFDERESSHETTDAEVLRNLQRGFARRTRFLRHRGDPTNPQT
jgi:hypothetical protein